MRKLLIVALCLMSCVLAPLPVHALCLKHAVKQAIRFPLRVVLYPAAGAVIGIGSGLYGACLFTGIYYKLDETFENHEKSTGSRKGDSEHD